MLTISKTSRICEGNGKKLVAFPLSVDQLHSFTEIYLQQNCLSSIPLALFQIPGLVVLNVSYNNLTELPIAASESENHWNCPNMKSLDISNNKLSSLPSVLWKISNLLHLYAQCNAISKIDSPENRSVKLEEINLSYNELGLIPLCIFHSKIVNISSNKLEELPESLWSLKTLKTLSVANNFIKRIIFPTNKCTSNLTITQSFTSKGRRALTTDGCTGNGNVDKSQCGGLLRLDLANNKLTDFPEDLACFAYYLEDLKISGNCIRTLYICLLPPYLKQLTAKECNLKYFGTACEAVTHSSHCYHRNHINLEKLTVLKLEKNFLGVMNFKCSLETSNRVLKFPNLEYLNLSNNDLCGELDDNIKYQRCLTTLCLSDNPQLRYLPFELSCLSDTLSTLILDNLPELIDPPKEYHSVPVKRLLSYFKSRLKR